MAIPFIPTVSQHFGRRYTILVGSAIMCLGAGLQAGAQNSDMFLASRWILGFGIPFAIVNASSLIGELSYAKERPVMTSLCVSFLRMLSAWPTNMADRKQGSTLRGSSVPLWPQGQRTALSKCRALGLGAFRVSSSSYPVSAR